MRVMGRLLMMAMAAGLAGAAPAERFQRQGVRGWLVRPAGGGDGPMVALFTGEDVASAEMLRFARGMADAGYEVWAVERPRDWASRERGGIAEEDEAEGADWARAGATFSGAAGAVAWGRGAMALRGGGEAKGWVVVEPAGGSMMPASRPVVLLVGGSATTRAWGGAGGAEGMFVATVRGAPGSWRAGEPGATTRAVGVVVRGFLDAYVKGLPGARDEMVSGSVVAGTAGAIRLFGGDGWEGR